MATVARWFDGYGLVQAFKKKAQALGAHFVQADVTAMTIKNAVVTEISTSTGLRLGCDTVVNAAGAWSNKIAAMMHVDIPVRARRRSIFNVSSPARLPACPLLVDTTGVYVRPEGNTFICGTSPAKDNDPDDLPLHEVDHALFEEVIWPTLAARIPAYPHSKRYVLKRAGPAITNTTHLTITRSLVITRRSKTASLPTASVAMGCNMAPQPDAEWPN